MKRSVTRFVIVSATRHWAYPANVRRMTTDVARSRPMPMMSTTPVTIALVATSPSS